MVRYITINSSNRIKICCIEDKNFSVTTDYVFTFTGNCSQYEMVKSGQYCGQCAEFIFVHKCDGTEDISLPRGLYKLKITSSLDQSLFYEYDQVRVQ